MKTNHRRGFVEGKKCRHNTIMHIFRKPFGGITKVGKIRNIGADFPGYDHSNGHRGTAKAIRGAKKYVRTRIRFHENQETKLLSYE